VLREDSANWSVSAARYQDNRVSITSDTAAIKAFRTDFAGMCALHERFQHLVSFCAQVTPAYGLRNLRTQPGRSEKGSDARTASADGGKEDLHRAHSTKRNGNKSHPGVFFLQAAAAA
jgi:hypothetical protein